MSDFLLTATKLLLAVLLMPIVVACAISFKEHLGIYPGAYQEFFLWGIMSFLGTFLFIYQFWGVYEFGQKVLLGAFKFLEPFNRVVANLIPFYLTAVMLFFYLTSKFLEAQTNHHYFMFFAGLFLAMHLLLTAQDLQNQEEIPLIKPTYLFWMCVIFIFNICLVVLFLDLNLGKWTFPRFATESYVMAKNIYQFSIKKILFL